MGHKSQPAQKLLTTYTTRAETNERQTKVSQAAPTDESSLR